MQEEEKRENGIFFCMNSLRIVGIHKDLATAHAEVQGNVENDKDRERLHQFHGSFSLFMDES